MVRDIAKMLLPNALFQYMQANRSRRYQVRFLERLGLLEASKRFVEQHGTVVQRGPFAGMVYPVDAAINRHSIPKILGTYELELHSMITLASSRIYDLIVDIGSAEGYYAVGLARLLQVPVLAFDPEPKERSFCQTMASLNGVAHLLQMQNLFRPSDIEFYSDKRILVICDCEGFEKSIFNDATVGKTGKWDLLIELHGETAQSLPLLHWPHLTSIIRAEARVGNFAELANIGTSEKLLSEYRNECQSWLWCDSQQSFCGFPNSVIFSAS